jgi:hypothetical protein
MDATTYLMMSRVDGGQLPPTPSPPPPPSPPAPEFGVDPEAAENEAWEEAALADTIAMFDAATEKEMRLCQAEEMGDHRRAEQLQRRRRADEMQRQRRADELYEWRRIKELHERLRTRGSGGRSWSSGSASGGLGGGGVR